MIEFPTSQPGGDLFIARITEYGAKDADGRYPHGWQEVRIDPTSLNYVDNELGRSGTITKFPAYEYNSMDFATPLAARGRWFYPGTLVPMRLRGWSEATGNALVYEIVCPLCYQGCFQTYCGNAPGNYGLPTDLFSTFQRRLGACAAYDGVVSALHSYSGWGHLGLLPNKIGASPDCTTFYPFFTSTSTGDPFPFTMADFATNYLLILSPCNAPFMLRLFVFRVLGIFSGGNTILISNAGMFINPVTTVAPCPTSWYPLDALLLEASPSNEWTNCPCRGTGGAGGYLAHLTE